MVPLLAFAGSRRRTGDGRIGKFPLVAGRGSCAVITRLDIYGLPGARHDVAAVLTGR
jgi:hypothetical protein